MLDFLLHVHYYDYSFSIWDAGFSSTDPFLKVQLNIYSVQFIVYK